MPTLEFRRADKHIFVPQPATEVTVQEIYDQAQEWLDDPENLREVTFVDAAGQFALGGGEFTATSVRLLDDWQLKFEDRLSDTVCLVLGGNLLATNSFDNNPIANSANVFAQIRQSTAPAAIEVQVPDDGITDQEVRDAMALAPTAAPAPDSIDDKLDTLGTTLATVDGKVDTVDGKIDTLDGAVGVVDGKLDTVTTSLTSLDGKVTTVDGKLDDVDSDLDVILAEVRDIDTGTGIGTVPVNHDYGGTDNYTYQTAAGAGIGGATIVVYLAADYNAGNRSSAFHQAVAMTDNSGRWRRSVMLDPGDYTLLYYKTGEFGPDLVGLTVV